MKMGYYTIFTGDINYTNPKVALLLERLSIDDFKVRELDNLEIDTKRKIIMFSDVELKNYKYFFERLCLAIAFFDNKAQGVINAVGEDKIDVWALEITKGNIIRLQGEIQYKEDTFFQEEAKQELDNIKKEVAKLTQRKDLLKEVALKEL